MAQYFLLFLITVHFLVLFANASETNVAPISSNAEAPTARRLGRHRHKHNTVKFLPEAPLISPVGLRHQDPHIAPTGETEAKKHHHHHESVLEESVAGGGVIVGGLATTFLVAIFCYIRATRRNRSNALTSSP